MKGWDWRPAGIGNRGLFLSGVMSFLRRWLMLWGDGESGEGTAIFMSFKYLSRGRPRRGGRQRGRQKGLMGIT